MASPIPEPASRPTTPRAEPPHTSPESRVKARREPADEEGVGSFPASDPPSHWAGKDKAPTLNGEDDEPTAQD